MTEKEPEKLAFLEYSDVDPKVKIGNKLLTFYGNPATAVRLINTAAESFAQRRVDEALERAAKGCECRCRGEHGEHSCTGCQFAKEIRSMKSKGAANG